MCLCKDRVTPINHSRVIFVVALILSLKETTGATFENVSLILIWRRGMQDQKHVTVSDDYLRSYVDQFGEVLIQNQKIPKLVRGSVSNLPKVTHLDLINCGIKQIEPGTFKNLPALTDLNLSGNLLEEIEDGVFDALSFRTLYLENNKIGTIGTRAFNNLKMSHLFIDDNRISIWKSEWFSGTPLVSVSMRNNRLQHLPGLAFEYLWHLNPAEDPFLENVILSGNNLKNIDPDAFDGIKMVLSLDLQNNSLTHLEPGLFDSVELIDRIELSDNRITELYYEVFRKTKISQLNVYNNLLECISTDIFNATELASLNIGKNPISCDCVTRWGEWKMAGKGPEITNLQNLEGRCESLANSSQCASLLVLIFSIVPFVVYLSA